MCVSPGRSIDPSCGGVRPNAGRVCERVGPRSRLSAGIGGGFRIAGPGGVEGMGCGRGWIDQFASRVTQQPSPSDSIDRSIGRLVDGMSLLLASLIGIRGGCECARVSWIGYVRLAVVASGSHTQHMVVVETRGVSSIFDPTSAIPPPPRSLCLSHTHKYNTKQSNPITGLYMPAGRCRLSSRRAPSSFLPSLAALVLVLLAATASGACGVRFGGLGVGTALV